MGSKSRRTPAPATPASVFVVSGTVEQLNVMVPVLASYFSSVSCLQGAWSRQASMRGIVGTVL
jgi:hypothetical protein